MTEEIINALAHVPGLKVAGRTSSFSFRGKGVEFDVIARKLNVDHILEGSVRQSGNRVRVTAQLIKVADGFHLWSERYDREMTEIFAMQDEITRAIATALQMKLSLKAAAVRLAIDENFALALETLGAICAQQGRFDEALALTERAYVFTPWASPTAGQLAALLLRAGDTGRSEAVLEKLRRGEVTGAATGLAVFHAMGGEFDLAAESAAHAIEERHPLLVRTLRPLLGSSPGWPALARMMKFQ